MEGLNALVQALGFGNPLGALVTWASAAGALAMGWLTAHYALAEGKITDWGTLGYVAVILGVALGLASLFAIISWGYRTLYPIRQIPLTAHGSTPIALSDGTVSDTELEDTDDEDALHDLTIFAIDYIMPLSYAHFKLQVAIISRSIPDAMPAGLAIGNLMTNYSTKAFGEHYDALNSKFAMSPMERVPFKGLKERILLMDKNFELLAKQTDELAKDVNVDYRSDKALVPLWRDICIHHNALVEEYKKIKRDRRFRPELYRPGINGPWTHEVH